MSQDSSSPLRSSASAAADTSGVTDTSERIKDTDQIMTDATIAAMLDADEEEEEQVVSEIERSTGLPPRRKREQRKRKRHAMLSDDDPSGVTCSAVSSSESDAMMSGIHTSDESLRHLARRKYEYLDHTADVQIHAWGASLKEAFEQCGVAVFGYIADELSGVELRKTIEFEASGHDLQSLLYNYLNELLGLHYENDYFIFADVCLVEFDIDDENGEKKEDNNDDDTSDPLSISGGLSKVFRVRGFGKGEPFSHERHQSGTEVKAITYSAMQILDRNQDGCTSEVADSSEDPRPRAELLVIVDI